MLGIKTELFGFIHFTLFLFQFSLPFKVVYALLSCLTHEGVIMILHIQLNLHLLDGETVSDSPGGWPCIDKRVGTRDAALLHAQRRGRFLIQLLHAYVTDDSSVVPSNLHLFFYLRRLSLDSVLNSIINRAKLGEQRLLHVLGMFVVKDGVGPIAKATHPHVVDKPLPCHLISILTLLEEERESRVALCAIFGIKVLHLVTAITLAGEQNLFLALVKVGIEQSHLFHVLTQILDNAVKRPFLADDFLNGVELLFHGGTHLQEILFNTLVEVSVNLAHSRSTLVAYLLNQVHRGTDIRLDERHAVTCAVGKNLIDGVGFLLRHLLAVLRVELLQFSALLTIHLFVLQHPPPTLFLGNLATVLRVLNLRLLFGVVGIELVHVVSHVVLDELTDGLRPLVRLLRVLPVASVGKEVRVQHILNGQALGVIPVDNTIRIALNFSTLDSFH